VDQVSAKSVFDEKGYILFYIHDPNAKTSHQTSTKHESSSVTKSEQLNSKQKASDDIEDFGQKLDRKERRLLKKKLKQRRKQELKEMQTKMREQTQHSMNGTSSNTHQQAPVDISVSITQQQTVDKVVVNGSTSTISHQTTTVHSILTCKQTDDTKEDEKDAKDDVVTEKTQTTMDDPIVEAPAPVIHWDESNDAKIAKLDAVMQREHIRRETTQTRTLEDVFGARDRTSQFNGTKGKYSLRLLYLFNTHT
jgi:hypothetical protein